MIWCIKRKKTKLDLLKKHVTKCESEIEYLTTINAQLNSASIKMLKQYIAKCENEIKNLKKTIIISTRNNLSELIAEYAVPSIFMEQYLKLSKKTFALFKSISINLKQKSNKQISYENKSCYSTPKTKKNHLDHIDNVNNSITFAEIKNLKHDLSNIPLINKVNLNLPDIPLSNIIKRKEYLLFV